MLLSFEVSVILLKQIVEAREIVVAARAATLEAWFVVEAYEGCDYGDDESGTSDTECDEAHDAENLSLTSGNHVSNSCDSCCAETGEDVA